MKIVSAFLTVCGLALAQAPQAPNPTQQPIDNGASAPIYRITVVARTTKAINYNHRSGPTEDRLPRNGLDARSSWRGQGGEQAGRN